VCSSDLLQGKNGQCNRKGQKSLISSHAEGFS
jgi:hypothetical protein